MAKTKTYYEKTGPGLTVGSDLPEDTLNGWVGALNGVCIQTPKVEFYDDGGGKINAEVTNERWPAQNLPYIIDGVIYYLNTTSDAGPNGGSIVSIPLGADASTIQGSFIYIVHNGGSPVLTATITFPVVESAPIGNPKAFNYTRSVSEGIGAFRKINDGVDNDTSDGMMRYILDALRIKLGTTWFSGCDATTTVDNSNIKIATSIGLIVQLHNQLFTTQDGNSYWVYNDNANAITYEAVSNLTAIIDDASGDTLLSNNTFYRLGVWALQNSVVGGDAGVSDKLIITRPLGSYTTESEALSDINNFDVGINDPAIEGITCPLYTMIIKREGASGVNITLVDLLDRRTRLVGGVGGAGATGGGSIAKGSALFNRAFSAGVINTNEPFEFANTVNFVDTSGNISKVSNTQIQLKAGRRYLLEGSINVSSASNDFINHQFYNVTNAQYFGVDGTVIVATNIGNSGSTTQAKGIIETTVDTVVEIRNQAGDQVTQYTCVVEVLEI